jgi:hypothetical protein
MSITPRPVLISSRDYRPYRQAVDPGFGDFGRIMRTTKPLWHKKRHVTSATTSRGHENPDDADGHRHTGHVNAEGIYILTHFRVFSTGSLISEDIIFVA